MHRLAMALRVMGSAALAAAMLAAEPTLLEASADLQALQRDLQLAA
jgi:hypothetical protein